MSSLEAHGGVKRLRHLIKKHVKAQIRMSWKGSMCPETQIEVEVAAKEAEQALNSFLKKLAE